jgi:hypothetical protein
MTGAHLSDHELVERLYGLAEEGDHLHECGSCGARWEAMRERKALVAATPVVSPEFIAAQRTRILTRLEQPARSGYRWAPALAAACLVVAGLFVFPTTKAPVVPARTGAVQHPAEPSDAQLFAEVYSIQESMEPRAAAPIHALFEEQE